MASVNALESDIPEYAKLWGRVERVDALPEGLRGGRISIEHIFLLKKTSDEEGYLVTSKTCDLCRKQKQFCTRGRPSCFRCSKGIKDCIYSDPSFHILQDLHVNRAPMKKMCRETTHSRQESTSDTGDLLSKSKLTKEHKTKQRPRSEKQNTRRISRPKYDLESPEKMRHSKTRSKRKVEIKEKIKVDWTISGSARQTSESVQPRPCIPQDARPLFWTESLDDLIDVYHNLSKAINGVSDCNGEVSPVILINNETWFDCDWDGYESIELSTNREYSCPETALKPIFELMSDQRTLVSAANDNRLHTEHCDHESISESGMQHINNSNLSQIHCDTEMACDPNDNQSHDTSLLSLPEHPEITKLAPSSLPGDIDILHRIYCHGMPIAVIMSTKSKLYPFQRFQDYGYVALGYFHIACFKMKKLSESSTQHNEKSLCRGTIQWKITLVWVEGGDIDDDEIDSSNFPWWMDRSCYSARNKNILLPKDKIYSSPVDLNCTILPKYFSAELSRFWRCHVCGKLNSCKTWCEAKKCSHCPEPNDLDFETPTQAVAAEAVRDGYRIIPLWNAFRDLPSTFLEETRRSTDGMVIYSYTGAEGADFNNSIRLYFIFPGNDPELEKDYNRMFIDFQNYVPMVAEKWNNASQPGTAGCFSYRVLAERSVCSRPDRVTWESAPGCIQQIREIITCQVKKYSNTELIDQMDRLDVIAWRWGDSKNHFSTKTLRSPIVLLVLGSDLELTVRISRQGQREWSRSSGKGASVSFMEPSSEDELGDQIVKRAPNSLNFDVFKFCMTHGSMLVINGAGVDISHSVVHSGFSIFLKGYYKSIDETI